MHDFITQESRDPDPLNISLRDVITRVWAGRRYVSGAVIGTFLLALVYLLIVPQQYLATMLVAPVSDQMSPGGQAGAAGSILGLFGGQEREAPPFEMFLELLSSVAVAEQLSHDSHIMQTIFADEWDQANDRWKEPGGLSAVRNGVAQLLGFPGWSPPSPHRLAAYLSDVVSIEEIGSGAIRRVSVTHPDKEFAIYLLQALWRAADGIVKRDLLARTNTSIEYLEDRIRRVTVADYRAFLIGLLGEQQKRVMMASTDLSFAALPLDPPSVADKPSAPSIGRTLLVSIVLGLLIGVALALVRTRR